MINYKGLQYEIIKKLMDNPKWRQEVFIDEDEENYFVSLMNTTVYIVPKRHFFINAKKITTVPLREHFNCNGFKPAELDCIKPIISDTIDCLKIINNSTTCYVNKKRLKYFKGIDHYKIKEELGIVLICDKKDKIMGLTLPMRLSEEVKF